jgi:hypothetical protein
LLEVEFLEREAFDDRAGCIHVGCVQPPDRGVLRAGLARQGDLFPLEHKGLVVVPRRDEDDVPALGRIDPFLDVEATERVFTVTSSCSVGTGFILT